MWMACTNRETIKVAASNGLGVLAFSFIDEGEARAWSQIYYDTIKSEACVPLGHSVNANIAMVSAFSLHADREEAVGRGMEGFEFFRFAISALVTNDAVPGRSRLFEQFQKEQGGVLDATRRLRKAWRAPSRDRPASARPEISALTSSTSKTPASIRSSCCNRPGGIGTSTFVNRWTFWRVMCCRSLPREPRSVTNVRPMSLRPMSRKRSHARRAWRRWRMRIFPW